MKKARFVEDIGAEIKIEEVDKTGKKQKEKDKKNETVKKNEE